MIRSNNENGVILEVGTGSGCVITYMAMLMKDAKVTNVKCIGIDINTKAVEMASATASNNNVNIEVVHTSFEDTYIEQYDSHVDIIIFNPPYVPTSDDELGSDGIEAAWAGGINGRVVIDKFLPIVSRLLSPKGKFYLVLVEENKPKQIINEMTKQGLKGEIVLKRQAMNEGLQILRFSR